MQTHLEIFYVRIISDRVCYQRKQVNVGKRGANPDRLIQSLIQEKRPAATGKVEEKEFLIHSTSWRYEKRGKVMLTYIAYSDELEFQKGKSKTFPLKKLKTITKKSEKPRTRVALEKKVVSHGLRHIAFLIRTDNQIDHRSTLTPETRDVFEKLWVSLAGKLF